MKTFVINMKKDVQRKKDMISQLDAHSVDHEFFEGVDGKVLSKEELHKIIDEEKLIDMHKRPINELLGLIGCTYSHYLIYKKMVDEKIPVACILEDDVILSQEFNNQLNWLENEIKTNEIVSLHTLLYQPLEFDSSSRVNNSCEILDPTPPLIRGTQGYVITNHCANQLIVEMMPILEFPDCFNRYQLFCPDVKIRVLFPFIIRHMWIDSVRDDKKNGIKDKLLSKIQKHQVFPFWNIMRSRRRRINDKSIASKITNLPKNLSSIYVKDIEKISIFDKY